MKRHVIVILSAVNFCLGIPALSPALPPPGLPDAPHNAFNCTNCHTGQTVAGIEGYNNICMTCHKPGSPKGGAKPFTPADAANPFGTISPARSGIIYQTSHNWSGSDTVPAAGALPPLNPNLNTHLAVGVLGCIRCHDPHSQTYPPFLWTANDRDQICLDCHRTRNVTVHTAGSHPVNVNYSSIASRNPSRYNNPPVNSNPANPTSVMNLINGTVLCSTCHRVHYADSNSATVDGPANYYSLKPSDGNLLRTDLHGATADSSTICSNCHKKKNHNGNSKHQNIQCADCHGAHVDVADGSVPNVYLVRRFINISTPYGAVRNRTVLFQTAAGNFKDANGTGICQACHVIPTGGDYPPEHAGSDNSVCMSCHDHDNPAGAFSAAGGCTTCHGQPPAQSAAGGPNGSAGNYLALTGIDEATTPHRRHAGGSSDYVFACTECHKGNSHISGTFQDVFIDKTAIIGASAGASPAYNGATRNCSNVYCHSNGAPRNASLSPVLAVKSIPAWPNGSGKITGCTACHDAQPATNAHTVHIAKGYGCATCHAATVSDNTTVANKAGHVNGIKDVSFSAAIPLAAGTAWDAATAGCSASKCHSNGTAGNTGAPVTAPVWVNSATGACGTCHSTSPVIAATSPQTIATGRHATHLTSGYGANLGTALTACQTCHDYTAAKHVNGTVDLLPGACTGCHPQAAPWTTAVRLACTSCHAATPSTVGGIAAPYKANFTTGGHGQAAAAFNASRQCESCHDANAPHISGVLGDATRLALANNNALCASCHSDAAKVPTVARQNMVSHVTVKGGAATSDCKLCHDVHGTTNISMVKTTINGKTIVFSNLSSGFIKSAAPFDGLCQTCHTQTVHYKSGQPLDGHPTKNCLSCHSHNGAFAFQPTGGGSCDSCHGYPPVPAGFVSGTGNYANAKADDYPGGGGAHVIEKHVPKSAVAAEGWSNCTGCHGNGSLNPGTHTMVLPVAPSKVTVDVQDSRKFNHTLPLGPQQYNGVLLDGGANSTGSCFNVSCHFQGSKKWSTVK